MFSWNNLPKPIVGLSAMDGVTDAAMRHITKVHGNPDFMVTEFTSAEGLARGISKLMRDLYFTPIQHPIIAQIFGSNPDAFYTAARICCDLGFDGIDINMGCPANSAVSRGGGAALIKTPELAKKIINQVKKATSDWCNETGGNILPVSVKTRTGYDKPVTEEWIKHLLETEPAVITLHGRTLEQHYGGEADWEEIGKAVNLVKPTNTLLFGNGDLKSGADILSRINQYSVDGVWVGRAAMGYPWIFESWRQVRSGNPELEIDFKTKCSVALEHVRLFEELNKTAFLEDPLPFLNLRKHLGWYVRGAPNAAELRAKLFQTHSIEEIEQILQ